MKVHISKSHIHHIFSIFQKYMIIECSALFYQASIVLFYNSRFFVVECAYGWSVLYLRQIGWSEARVADCKHLCYLTLQIPNLAKNKVFAMGVCTGRVFRIGVCRVNLTWVFKISDPCFTPTDRSFLFFPSKFTTLKLSVSTAKYTYSKGWKLKPTVSLPVEFHNIYLKLVFLV